jgi:phosphoglycolate phosphatase-like HAD superfamily hydrolase
MLETLGVPHENSIYVGDTDIDMQTTVAAGIRGVGTTTGNFSAKELKEHGAWRVIDDIREIMTLILE